MLAEAIELDEWRPGFARRADNFNEVCALASQWRYTGETVAGVMAAILKGTPALTHGQRTTLMLYVDHLSEKRLEDNNACVYPSASLMAQYLGCSLTIARAHRKALEAAGYLLRDYNRANRPAGREAIDLSPLLARLPEIKAAADAARSHVADVRAAYLEHVVHCPEIVAHPPKNGRLEQPYKNDSSTVTETDTLTARHEFSARRPQPAASGEGGGSSHHTAACRTGNRGSSGGARFDVKACSEPIVRAEMARDEALAALEASPQLAQLLPRHLIINPLDTRPSDIDAIAQAAQALLPQPHRNNGETARWGWRKHGPRVIAMLAIAIEDAGVRDPCAYFGKLASSDRSFTLDLRLNLRRIIQARAMAAVAAEMPTPQDPASFMAGPGADDPVWQAIDAKLRQIVPIGAYGSWFSRLGFAGIRDGVLALTTSGKTSADRLKAQFLDAIGRAADTAGYPIQGVTISIRRTGNRQ